MRLELPVCNTRGSSASHASCDNLNAMKRLLIVVLFTLLGIANAQVTRDSAGFLIARPATSNGVLFVLMPGGLVPPAAYGFIGEALAAQGITTVIPEVPFQLAFFDYNSGERAVQSLEKRGEKYRKIIYGGHSLGGAMAGLVTGWGGRVDGLVLMAAYPAANCSGLKIPALTIAAGNDGLINSERIRASLAQLPANTTLEIIPGGVHAFFGRYGVQRGDGTPTITREAFEARLLEVMGGFFQQFSR
jgi:dienelactone hydrolase